MEMLTDDEVKQALEDLPENFRLPVLLADVEGFAYKEIAEMLDIPIGTVMSRLHRGRKAMQKALYDYANARGLATPPPTRPPTDEGRTVIDDRTDPMADCNETLRELESFLDEELTDDSRDVIHAHLDGCPDCLQAFDFHAELKAVIAQKCRNDELPPGLADRIQACFGDDTAPVGEPDAATARAATCAARNRRSHARYAARHARSRDLALVDRRHPHGRRGAGRGRAGRPST